MQYACVKPIVAGFLIVLVIRGVQRTSECVGLQAVWRCRGCVLGWRTDGFAHTLGSRCAFPRSRRGAKRLTINSRIPLHGSIWFPRVAQGLMYTPIRTIINAAGQPRLDVQLSRRLRYFNLRGHGGTRARDHEVGETRRSGESC